MKRQLMFVLMAICLFVGPSTVVASPMLYDWAFNINGDLYTPPSTYSGPAPGQLPDFVDYSGFDWTAGLGTITMTYAPAVTGNYFLISFFDHEFVEQGNSYFNEFGVVHGTVAAGQSWEIDEPGYVFGDIRTYYINGVEYVGNVENGTLDNFNNVPEGLEDDVSMALGWNFALTDNESAMIEFILAEVAPDNLFSLSHTDPESDQTIYFSSTLDIQSSAAPVPEPGTMMLLATGLFGLFGMKRKWFDRR